MHTCDKSEGNLVCTLEKSENKLMCTLVIKVKVIWCAHLLENIISCFIINKMLFGCQTDFLVTQAKRRKYSIAIVFRPSILILVIIMLTEFLRLHTN